MRRLSPRKYTLRKLTRKLERLKLAGEIAKGSIFIWLLAFTHWAVGTESVLWLCLGAISMDMYAAFLWTREE